MQPPKRRRKIMEERFEKVYTQGKLNIMEIWVDKETGVQYVYHLVGYAGGMSPLLDADGKPLLADLSKLNDAE
ncbi:hypothetical protein K3V87_08840 [Listeria monocytogenes]|uniref:DUF6440 domain-containing protein n=4 Tax=Listeria monocytogenes TaxID=1639 RepID=A0A9P1T3M2_LISMN|nr:DUF6440 family protein [Listeria monocytogenes]EAD3237217.1 hypothetical protein [Listeria monocytogenes CFSAN002202]EAD5040187.1 hypothetical protein [Listeria monocytogenes serotype 1/2a]EAE6022759.1 hypothetical protein [Listeria monocytogenes serotype 3a]EAF4522543.1 hypothetical protein [Listeria monocytogenes serotype 4b]EAG6283391.1 hypothetical protein [Listeria monocytogenes CFSAN003810]EAG9424705.1 hypothetical protein [Listeria monocytogenes CFSAN002184]EAG9460355.1 hypothetica